MNRIYSASLTLATSFIGIVTWGTVGETSVQAANFEEVNVMGDSLSDAGNIFNLTEGVVPENPLSFEGRFSDGEVWVEYFTQNFGLNPTLFTVSSPSPEGTNFAIGGSNSDNTNIINILQPDLPIQFPGLEQQLDAFIAPLLATNQSANPDALYTLWVGSNDYIFGDITNPDLFVNMVVNNISNAIQSLYDIGARNFLVFDVGGISQTPLVTSQGLSEELNLLTETHNFFLELALENLSQSLTDINIIPFQVSTLFETVIENPEEFGLTNVTDSWSDAVASCLAISCSEVPNPDEYLFWDSIHVTTAAHQIIAEEAFLTVTAKSHKIPEPSVTWALSGLGLGLLLAKVSSSQRRD